MPPTPPASPGRPGLRQAVVAFRYRDFAVFWVGALLSNTGTWVQSITVPYVIYDMTGSAAWVGLAAFAQWLPGVLIGPVAGALADRFPRRTILAVTQAGLAVLALALWAVWSAGLARPGLLVAMVTCVGLVGGLNMPSWQAFVSDLVPRSALLNAVTLNSAQFNASRALGPALGGVVLATLGPGAAFLVNAGSYAAVLVALGMIRLRVTARPRATDPVWSRFVDGVRYTRAHRGLVACVTVALVLGTFGMPVFQLAPVFARDVYDVGGALYGLLTASMGIGAVLGAPIVGGWAPQHRRSRVAAAGLVLYGVAVTAFGLAPSFWPGFAAALVIGAAHLALASVLNTTIQLLVDEEMRGRVISIYLMVLTGGMPVGALVQGQLADAVGAPATVTMVGAVMLAAAVALHLRPGLLGSMDDAGPAPTDLATPAVGAAATRPVPAEVAGAPADVAGAGAEAAAARAAGR